LRNQLKGFVPNTITGNFDTVSFTGNQLNPTVMPRLEVGYRLADNWGSLQFDYRFLSTQGSDTLVTGNNTVPAMPASQQGRLTFNILDLTYVSQSFSLRPNWEFRGGVGPRMMTLFFDSRIQFLNPGADLGAFLSQGESNSFYGFGGWAFLDVERHTCFKGLSIFGRMEGMDLYSRITQNFTETVAGGPGALPQTFYGRFTGGVGNAQLRGILGLSYLAPWWNYSRFMVGYQYESFFQVGRLTAVIGGGPDAPDDRAQLTLQGLFLRAEFNF
jgi:hypothetical protein